MKVYSLLEFETLEDSFFEGAIVTLSRKNRVKLKAASPNLG
jgi:hypothetical protein